MDVIISALLGLLVGAGAIFGGFKLLRSKQRNTIEQERKRRLEDANSEAETIRQRGEVAAKEEFIRQRTTFERETSEQRGELKEIDRRLSKREDNLERKLETLTLKERNIDNAEQKLGRRDRDIQKREQQIAEMHEEQRTQLLHISGLSPDDAKRQLLERIENEVRSESSALVERITAEAKESARDKSREIIMTAIQRFAAEHASEGTVSTVDIPSDDMKGRVIGREGRNIRAFEKATGVDVIVDDTPGVVVVSAFDPVRREVARRSLEGLITDGRIHPSRIEEIVTQQNKLMDEELVGIGKKALTESSIRGLHGKLIPLLGRLQFRTSYGQNVLRHSVEVAFMADMMAEEIGLKGELARRCGLLHDIGKAVDHDMEGGHPAIGAELCKRYNERSEVINAAAAHHGDVEATSFYTLLVAAADAISAARPGARRETLDRYIKRLEKLEEIATAYPGVVQAYAIQAGREVRVMVDAARVNDGESMAIAQQIAKKIEEEMTYPGEIRVTLMRETRCVEYAR